jgi:hypothetical protein
MDDDHIHTVLALSDHVLTDHHIAKSTVVILARWRP